MSAATLAVAGNASTASLDVAGNAHVGGTSLRVEGGISAGGAYAVSIDAPGVVGGRFMILPNGNVGINNNNPQYTLDVAGNGNLSGNLGIGGSIASSHDVTAGGNIYATYRVIAGHGFTGVCNYWLTLSTIGGPVNCDAFDLAEAFPSAEATEPGDVLTIDTKSASKVRLRKSRRSYDTLLLGVVSTTPGVALDGSETHVAGDNSKLITPTKTVVALAGRVPVKISMENGPVNVGDPLTSSSKPGVAMKATRSGKILGYALESASTNGKVLLFVQPGYYAVPDVKRLHTETATMRNEVDKLSRENSELRTQNIQLQRQMQQLLYEVKVISHRMDNTLLAQSRP